MKRVEAQRFKQVGHFPIVEANGIFFTNMFQWCKSPYSGTPRASGFVQLVHHAAEFAYIMPLWAGGYCCFC